jgi:septal ring factor EnvC (AmiA/AmiB activator)
VSFRAAWLILAVLAAWPARAEPTRQQLQNAEAARAAQLAAGRAASDRLRAAQAEAQKLAEARVATAAQLRGLETATADAATAMDQLSQRRAAAQERLAARAADLGPLLPLIERLSLFPAETLLVVPAPPEDALRGLLVLKGMARQLETEAEALRAEEAEVTRLSTQISLQETRLASAQSAQAAQAAALDRQIAEARARSQDAEGDLAESSRRAAIQAAQADSLRAALAQLDASRRQAEARAKEDAALADRQRQTAIAADARRRQAALAAPAGPGLAEPRGQLGAPVAGTVVKAFGESGDAGPTTGISYQTPPAARVAAPCGGRVVFAGPFRSYGVLLILDCGGGYHFVLAGLERLDVQVGRPVQPGEPVGVMPSWDPRAPGARPALYVELRKDGLPVNPAPFLRGRS